MPCPAGICDDGECTLDGVTTLVSVTIPLSDQPEYPQASTEELVANARETTTTFHLYHQHHRPLMTERALSPVDNMAVIAAVEATLPKGLYRALEVVESWAQAEIDSIW